MSTVINTVAKPLIDQKANKTMNINEASIYGKPDVSFFTIAKYSLSWSTLFYVAANVYATYYMSTLNENKAEQFFTLGFILFLSQVMYNYLELNSDNYLQKIQKYSS